MRNYKVISKMVMWVPQCGFYHQSTAPEDVVPTPQVIWLRIKLLRFLKPADPSYPKELNTSNQWNNQGAHHQVHRGAQVVRTPRSRLRHRQLARADAPHFINALYRLVPFIMFRNSCTPPSLSQMPTADLIIRRVSMLVPFENTGYRE